MTAPPSRGSESKFTVRRLSDDVVEAVFFGRLTAEVVEHSGKEVVRLLKERRTRWYVVDMGSVTKVDAAIRTPAATTVKEVVAQGVEGVLTVTAGGAARMIGVAVAFATGAPVRFFATRLEAQEYMDRHRR